MVIERGESHLREDDGPVSDVRHEERPFLPTRRHFGLAVPESFDATLRRAIDARGLTLDRLRHHLAARGHDLSIATLSYWQTGRSRPVRGASLAALADLETILGLPTGDLTARLGERSRGRTAAIDDVCADRPLDDLDAYFWTLCDELGVRRNDGYRRMSLHERIELRADRTLASRATRELVRATRDGFDRFPLIFHHDEPGGRLSIAPVSNCTLGRILYDRDRTTVAAEVLLPRPLAEGESMIVELIQRVEGLTSWEDAFWRSTDQRTRQFVSEVVFHPDDLPLGADIVTHVDGRETAEPVAVTSPVVTVLVEDFGPGIYGLRWRWSS